MARPASSDPIDNFRFRVFAFNNPLSGLGSSISSGLNALAQGDLAAYMDLTTVGFFECTLPEQTTSYSQYRELNEPSRNTKRRSKTSFSNVSLRSGVTSSDSSFYKWACKAHNPSLLTSINRNINQLAPFKVTGDSPFYRKDLVVEALGKDGEVVKRWYIIDAAVANYKPGAFNTREGELLIQSLELVCESCIEILSIDDIIVFLGQEAASYFQNDYLKTTSYLF